MRTSLESELKGEKTAKTKFSYHKKLKIANIERKNLCKRNKKRGTNKCRKCIGPVSLMLK